MNKIQFYRCSQCGSILTNTGKSEIHCCGQQLEPLTVQELDAAHLLKIEELDDTHYITLEHPMTKEHFIAFVAWTAYDRTMVVQLYPEQGAELRVQLPRRGEVYVCCSQHGLFCEKLNFRK